MKCPKCRFENPENTRFCGNCAAPLSIPDETLDAPTETLVTPVPDITRGSILSERYEIIEEIGKGGMGKVYKAFDKDINENIALKIIRPEIAANTQIITRFQNELKMARKIAHRNVCKMYDLGKDGDTKYISMEYVQGEDLKTTIKRMGPLTVGKAIHVARQVCEGLAEAHRIGVIHRDLKPRNIMIDRDGNARIMDFGIAASHEVKEISDSRIMLGTPHYMSPEQVSGKPTDRRSDIYSLGIIMFEMVTGQVPFDGDTTISIALKHKSEQPPNPVEINYRIPDEFSQLILKCLKKDKENRYQSAEELLFDLRKIEDEIPTTERILIRERTRTRRLRSRVRPLGIAGIALGVVFIIIAGYLILNEKRKEEITPTASKKAVSWSNSIAILPFKDLSPEGDQEYLCESMMASLITKLRSLSPDLKVISQRTVLKYKNMSVDITHIGKELDVKTILDGSIQIIGNRILVNAWLTNVHDNSVIWPFEHEGKFESVLDVQDEITLNLARELNVHFQDKNVEMLKQQEPQNIDAYVFYSRGTHFERLYRDEEQEEDFETAERMYSRAIEIDPLYALAYIGMGNLFEYHFVLYDREQDMEIMLQNYQKAYELAPDMAESNVGLGWYHFYHQDNDSAYKYYKRAFELNPNDPDVNYNIGGFFRSIGLFKKAIKYYSRAIDLNPLDPIYRSLRATCYINIGEVDNAIADNQEIRRMYPEDLDVILRHARFLLWDRRLDEADKLINDVEIIDPDLKDIPYTRALVCARRGNKERALELIEGIERYYYYHSLFSHIYAVSGMEEEAIDVIQDGIDKGYEKIKTYIYTYLELINNPYFDGLRGNPRFQEIIRSQKEKYNEMLSKYSEL
ncbi:MAG: protein kinase [Candidatus Aminicenantes bacterium]|jgi:serine/threonine-protein kinase